MARPITTKHIQEHYQCSCGFNSVDHDDLKMRHKDLLKVGGKRRVEKADGHVWYSLQVKYEGPCDGNHFN